MNKKPQKSVLTKKKKQSMALKIILAQPYPRYWPQINEIETNELQELLLEIQSGSPTISKLNESLLFGISSTMRFIKAGKVKVVFISADLRPRYIVNQIILLTLAKNIPVIIFCIPKLEELSKEIFKFSSLCFTIIADHGTSVNKLVNWSKNLRDNNYPIPNEILSNFTKKPRIISIDIDEEFPKSSKETEAIRHKLYLRAGSNDQRAFVPVNALNLKPLSFKVQYSEKDHDFISINDDSKLNTINKRDTKSKVLNQNENRQKKNLSKKNKYVSTTVWKIMKNK